MLYSFPLLVCKKRHYICKYFYSTLQKQHWWRNTWIHFEVCSLYCVWPVSIISIALGKTRLLLVSSADCSENPNSDLQAWGPLCSNRGQGGRNWKRKPEVPSMTVQWEIWLACWWAEVAAARGQIFLDYYTVDFQMSSHLLFVAVIKKALTMLTAWMRHGRQAPSQTPASSIRLKGSAVLHRIS